MKKFGWMVVMLLASSICWGINCDDLVNDTASVLQSTDMSLINQASAELVKHGADVRVLTTGLNGHPTLDSTIEDIRKGCPSWQSPNGGIKSTLVVIAVAPKEHKSGIFFGAAMKPAFDSHFSRISSDYMNPRFKQGEFAQGLIAAEEQLGKRLAAAQDEALHPATNTTINQPEDLSGLWAFLEWTLGVGFFIGMVLLGINISRKRREQQTEIAKTQQRAKDAYSHAADLILDMRPTFESVAGFNVQVDRYTRLLQTLENDPTRNGASLAEYASMYQAYQSVCDKLESIKANMGKGESASLKTDTPTPKPSTHKKVKTKVVEPPAPKPEEKVVEKTVEVHDNSGNFVDGLVIGSVLGGRGDEEDERPSRRHRDDDDSSSSSSSGSSWGGGSSDSGSSSSSDWGGGSSDFGGGGGDSGGGSSSW